MTGLTTVTGGTLHLKFVNGCTPKAGNTTTMVDGTGSNHQSLTVVVNGFQATAIRTATDIQAHLDV